MFKYEKVEVLLTSRNISHYRKFNSDINCGSKISVDVSILTSGSDQRVDVVCDRCKIDFTKKFNNLIRDRKNSNGLDFCGSCGRQNSGLSSRLGFEFVKSSFIEKNLIPLFEFDDYKSCETKLKFRCKYHMDMVQVISYNGLSQSSFPCKECCSIRLSKVNRLGFNEIYNYFSSRGLIVDKFLESIDTNTKIEFRCQDHINSIQSISYRQLKLTKNGCKFCLNKKGKNSSWWRGGITPLVRYMRNGLGDWKLNRLKESNYTCEVSGLTGDLVVHHIENFHIILDKSLDALNIKYLGSIGEYSDGQLFLIENKLLELHHGCRSVVMLKTLHTLFHSIYGLKNNNYSQYIEFCDRYKIGEFNDKLPLKYKFINNPSDL